MYHHTKYENFLLNIADKLELLAYNIQNYVTARIDAQRSTQVDQVNTSQSSEIGELTAAYYMTPELFYSEKTVQFLIMNYKRIGGIYETARVCCCNVEDLQKVLEANLKSYLRGDVINDE